MFIVKEILERCHRLRSGILIVNFEHISHLFIIFCSVGKNCRVRTDAQILILNRNLLVYEQTVVNASFCSF